MNRPLPCRLRALLTTLTSVALVLCMPRATRAASIVEFATRCFDGDTLGSFIELTGNAGESTRNGMRLRVLDRNGAIVFDIDAYGARGSQVFNFQEGNRHFLLATRALIDEVGFDWGPAPLGYADNILPFALDPVAGRIQLYLLVSGREQIVSQVPYGAGLLALPPLPGLSSVLGTGGWVLEPHPVLESFFHSTIPIGQGPAPACLASPEYHLSAVRLQCEDGDTRGQYVEVDARGPTGNLGERVQLFAFDHLGAQLGSTTNAFSSDPNSAAFGSRHWLMTGPEFVPGGPDTADARLPFTLDPAGGTLQLVVTTGALLWSTDRFAYGTPSVPLPATGKSYVRLLGSSLRTLVVVPHNSNLAAVEVPHCAAGSGIGHPIVQELALACTDGLAQGQFIELSTRGSSLSMTDTYRLIHYRRDGSLAFEVADVFAGIPDPTLERDRSWLLIPAGDPRAVFADRVLPDTLDREAGAIELWRPALAGDSLAVRFDWGAPPLALPLSGGSLEASTLVPQLIAYPSPTPYSRSVLPHDDCTADRDIVPLSVLRLALDCSDRSRAAAFVELDGLTLAQVRDTRLGLRWLSTNGAEVLRVEPLFPPRPSWDLSGSPHWLVAVPGFESRTGLAPDVTSADPLTETPTTLQLYRRDPVTNAATTMGVHPLQLTLLAPGRGEVRTSAGQYEFDAQVAPQRFDGVRAAAGACWTLPHPEAVRLASMLLRCRTGGTGAQYIQLAAAGTETMYSRDLLLRVRDRAGLEIAAIRAPFPAAYADRIWPADRALLVGGPDFAARFGVAPDATLPAALDTVGGRIELVLARVGGAEIPLDALDYGPNGIATPSPGAALVAADGAWRTESLPRASGISFEIAAPTACLGECPGRTVRFAVGGEQPLVSASGHRTEVGADLGFDGPRGTFELSSSFGDLALRWDDRYVLEGLPPGTTVSLAVRVRNALTFRDTCLTRPPICLASFASVAVYHGSEYDSTEAQQAVRNVELPLAVRAGEAFDLLLSLRANAAPSTNLPASTRARLEFVGLADGVRVRSCNGFDSRTQRGVGAPVVDTAPRRIEVRWPVTGDASEVWVVERSADDGEWHPLETRTADADRVLRIVDTRVAAGHVYAYRTIWGDEYGSYVSAIATSTTLRPPGYSFEGVAPNPSTGTFGARFEIPEAGVVSLDVLDLAGRVITSRTRSYEPGRYTETLAQNGAIAPGVYTVRMRYRGLTSWHRVVVLR